MPYMKVVTGTKVCVHKQNQDGTAGVSMFCYDSPSLKSNQQKADAYLGALYANVPDAGKKRSQEDGMNIPVPLMEVLTDFVKRLGGMFKKEPAISPEEDVSQRLVDVLTAQKNGPVFRFIDQPDGKVRWFAWPAAVAILNKANEVDTTQLYRDFISRVAAGEPYPYLTFYHQGEAFQMGQADWLDLDGFLYLASGLMDNSDIARAMRKSAEADPAYWGTSIGFLPVERQVVKVADGVNVPMYTRGVNREISVVPETDACHFLTSFGINNQEEVVRMKNKNLEAALHKLAGDDDALFQTLVKRAEGNEGLNRAITDAGIVARVEEPAAQAEPAAPVAPVAETPPAAPEAPVQEIVADESLVDEIVNRLTVEDGPLATMIANSVSKALEGMPAQADLDEIKRVSDEERQKLIERLAKLEGEQVEETQEVVRNTPRKLVAPAKRVIFRNTQRQVVREQEASASQTFADIAAETLSGMNAKKEA